MIDGCPRQAENGRENRYEAEVMVCFDYEPLFRGLVLDQLKHPRQGIAIAEELIAAKRLAVVHGVIYCLACHGRLVRHLRYVIPAARIRDTYEQRKHPQPQSGGGEAFAMAL